MDIVDIYPDGSFNGSKASWAFIAVKEDKIIHSERGVLEGDINKMWQVGGEMAGVMKGVEFCIKNNLKCNIYYDLINLYKWCADIFGEKPWRRKNQHTRLYHDFMVKNKAIICKMIKVKSHSFNKFNDAADVLAKEKNDNSAPKIKKLTLSDKVREFRDEIDKIEAVLESYPYIPEDVWIGNNTTADRVKWLVNRLIGTETALKNSINKLN